MAAIAMAGCLSQSTAGEQAIRRMIVEDIAVSQARGNAAHAAALTLALQHFVATHPLA